ncbi:hypothetical protein DKM44_10090 [Deinococcus irradiatisoli]|uniref:AraC family transcriptional regulator n=1 Tax=Deinococcus irradiatisoli TaxID=2202254 RepID=A0A2Z3JIV2_9DEIO|nr:hypothetical protein [Deinococcus irradiatisoli]AWN23531.1 hypothetical protein DKM44_10090 [Deinococcus irradiatisoli]
MPGPAPQPPAALHLARLAKVTPDRRVRVPGSPLEALYLTRAQPQAPAGGAAVCMEGELLIDFADGSFVHLRPGEACALALPHRLLPARGSCTALLVGLTSET